MLRKTKILLFSCAAILLCICVVVGILYSLFTDSVEIKHHLSANNLDAVLERTYLTYRVPDSNGFLAEYLNPEIVDFSRTTQDENNIFGLGQDVPVVPGCYYESQLSVTNKGSVSFTYDVKIDFNSTESAANLANQLLVTVSTADGTKLIDSKPLSSVDLDAPIFSGELYPDAPAHEFAVRIDFINSEDNNNAQNEFVYFDLYVSAVQAKK